ncbi:MAG: LuxR C-terminal-related transcriptional regulator [Chloroflexota bacterium]
MTTAVLTTKLFRPIPRPNRVHRPRLLQQLDSSLGKLILVSAAAGSGKTTLLSEWIAQQAQPVAWLSLDANDNDPTRFFTYVMAALQTAVPTLGEGIVSAFNSPQPPPIAVLFTTLINELATLENSVLLVLDDYHVIEAGPIHQAISFLLDHLPPQLRLLIATREDPPLPLPRLRVRGEMIELRAGDLRFTAAETAVFLNETMGLDLTEADIAALEARTEGWIAGLQMAALSMTGQADRHAFVDAFTGSHRFVVDYLIEEVLQQQSERMRRFLLETAVLEQLNGSLCAAVTEQTDCAAMLEQLERDNLFVVPLDNQRRWYRYHHLFADVLHARLQAEQPTRIATLHQRASQWYEANGQPLAAIRHAIAGEDFGKTAVLIEQAWPQLRRNRQEAALLGWLKQLPEEQIQARPLLSVIYAWVLLDSGQWEKIEDYLQLAERGMERAEAGESSLQTLPALLTNARAYYAKAIGDVAATIKYAQAALRFVPADDHYERGTAAAFLGLAYWDNGDLDAAYRHFAEGLAALQKGGGALSALGGHSILGALRIEQGRLRDAATVYERGLQMAAALEKQVPVATADLHRGLAELHCEWGDLATAKKHLLLSQAQGKQTGLVGDKLRWCLAQSKLEQAQGNLAKALDWIYEAERLHHQTPLPNLHPTAAIKARLWLAQGRLADALAWARERQLSAADAPNYLQEYEHITLVRLLLAQFRQQQTESTLATMLGLLKRLLNAAETGRRQGRVIELLLLQALAYEAQGKTAVAQQSLTRALVLAEPENYVRLFVDEGQPLARLLQAVKPNKTTATYVTKLLTIFAGAEPQPKQQQGLAEPLSERELEVLRLLATDLSGPDIARELMIALSTFRTHTKNIYGKLGANNRRTAVTRAEKLNLLP